MAWCGLHAPSHLLCASLGRLHVAAAAVLVLLCAAGAGGRANGCLDSRDEGDFAASECSVVSGKRCMQHMRHGRCLLSPLSMQMLAAPPAAVPARATSGASLAASDAAAAAAGGAHKFGVFDGVGPLEAASWLDCSRNCRGHHIGVLGFHSRRHHPQGQIETRDESPRGAQRWCEAHY